MASKGGKSIEDHPKECLGPEKEEKENRTRQQEVSECDVFKAMPMARAHGS